VPPLVVDDGWAAALFWALTGGWWLGETVLAVRTTLLGEGRRDRSFMLMTAITLGSLAGAIALAHSRDDLALPGPGWWPLAAGAALVVAGVGLRVWAIRELGRFFTYAVLVHEGQRVVESGPYRRVRHPSYTGLLAGMLGVGLMLGTWLSVAVAFVPSLAGFTGRLLAEERVLAVELGEPYRDYMRRTRRLLPWVW
jgi:protein-S-isoprenylcysteine O-methyltransferase Ste14